MDWFEQSKQLCDSHVSIRNSNCIDCIEFEIIDHVTSSSHIYKYIYDIFMYTFILIYRRHVTASLCDIAFLIWSGCFYSQLVENRRSLPTPNFWRKWHLPNSESYVFLPCRMMFCVSVFFALLNNGTERQMIHANERLETTLHQLKISLFWPLKMLGINSLPGFVFFYRKGFHLLCRRKPVKNPTVTSVTYIPEKHQVLRSLRKGRSIRLANSRRLGGILGHHVVWICKILGKMLTPTFPDFLFASWFSIAGYCHCSTTKAS